MTLLTLARDDDQYVLQGPQQENLNLQTQAVDSNVKPYHTLILNQVFIFLIQKPLTLSEDFPAEQIMVPE